jgi:hypothetical protein
VTGLVNRLGEVLLGSGIVGVLVVGVVMGGTTESVLVVVPGTVDGVVDGVDAEVERESEICGTPTPRSPFPRAFCVAVLELPRVPILIRVATRSSAEAVRSLGTERVTPRPLTTIAPSSSRQINSCRSDHRKMSSTFQCELPERWMLSKDRPALGSRHPRE